MGGGAYDSDVVHTYHIKSPALGHIMLGTCMIINFLIWYVKYPLDRRVGACKKESQLFDVEFWYGLSILAQIIQCICAITFYSLNDGSTTYNIALFIGNMAILFMSVTIIMTSIDIFCVKKRKLAKLLMYRYGIVFCIVLFGFNIGLGFTVNLEAAGDMGLALIFILRIVYISSLIKLIIQVRNISNYQEEGVFSIQFILIVIGQFANCIAVIVLFFVPQLGTKYGMYVLGSGIYNYTMFTLFISNGLVPVLEFVNCSGFNQVNPRSPTSMRTTANPFDDSPMSPSSGPASPASPASPGSPTSPVSAVNPLSPFSLDPIANANANTSGNINDSPFVMIQQSIQLFGIEHESNINVDGLKDEPNMNQKISIDLCQAAKESELFSIGNRLSYFVKPIKALSLSQRLSVELENDHDNKESGSSSSSSPIAMYLMIKPEAFRMWFYILFVLYCLLAYIITTASVDINYNDNIILNTFGSNNVCLYFDFAPFNYFGTSLWFFVYTPMLIYLIFDLIRIYQSYLDNIHKNYSKINKKFFIVYTIVTIYEILAGIFFFQITATSPFENITLHAVPYVFFSIQFLTIALKRFIYFDAIGLFKQLEKKQSLLYRCIWIVNVIGLTFSALFRVATALPNAFGAKIFEINGFEWTNGVSVLNSYLILFMAIIYPMCSYIIMVPYFEPIKIVVGRYRYQIKK